MGVADPHNCYAIRIGLWFQKDCKNESCNGITTLYATQESIEPKKLSLNISIGKTWEITLHTEYKPWECLCVNLIGPYKIKTKKPGHKITELRCVTMIDPVTGWFKIKQYDDKKSITVANIVEQELVS